MKTPIEFDYDLWTTEEGKCMVRVKLTGEVCEVSRETMRVLRNEEKKLRRSKTGVPIAGCEDEDETATLLSLDFVSVQDAEEMSPAWLEDPNDLEETVLTSVMEQEFRLVVIYGDAVDDKPDVPLAQTGLFQNAMEHINDCFCFSVRFDKLVAQVNAAVNLRFKA